MLTFRYKDTRAKNASQVVSSRRRLLINVCAGDDMVQGSVRPQSAVAQVCLGSAVG